ncbi:MAG: hypothetical protein LC121_00780 [Anaerolineae bacterium]|nr:hypothetical protein [Anaerolineae bacterium]
MIEMLKRHEIQVLRWAGHSLQEVAKLAGVSQSSVQRVEAEPVVATLDTAGERVRRGVGRPGKVEAFREFLAAELAKQPGVLGVELLRRARLTGYTGGKSPLYELIAAIRPRENLVGWVKGSFFKQRRFLDEEDLRRQLVEWHEEVNVQRPSRATRVPPAARIAEDRARLRPLKLGPQELALRFPVMVGPTAVVAHDGRTYSMPPEAIGIPGTLYLYRERVRIVAGRFQAEHPRQLEPRARSILPEHRAQHLAAVSGQRAKRYLQREHLLGLGQPALEYLTELTHRRPRLWVRDVHQLHELLQQHGADTLRAAFEHGLAEQLFGAEYIAHALSRSQPPRPGRRQQELAL